MRLVHAVGLLAFVGAVAVVLWPLHANGVRGSALAPRYHGFYVGVADFAPLPAHPTKSYLRRHGVRLPEDVVADRRRAAAVVLVAGLAAATAVGASGAVAASGGVAPSRRAKPASG